jgi:catalase
LDPESAHENLGGGFRSFQADDQGEKTRTRSPSFADHYSQARQFFISQSDVEQAHIASSLVFELSKVQTKPIVEAMVGHLRHVHPTLAKRVADGLGMSKLPAAPRAAVPPDDRPMSPALQIIGKMQITLQGRAVGILIGDGSDRNLVESLSKAAVKAGATVKIVAPKIAGVRASDGTTIPADGQLAGTPSVLFDAVAVILSAEGARRLASEAAAVDFVRDAFGHLKAIAVDAGGQALMKSAGVVTDAGVLAATDSASFIAAAKTRQWAREPNVRTLA